MRNKKIYLLFVLSICISPDAYSQWVTLNSGSNSNLKSVCFVNSDYGVAAGSGGLVIKTTNGGANWTVLNSSVTDDINSIFLYNLLLGYACCNSGKIILTSNGGTNWSIVSSGVTDNLYSGHGNYISGAGGTLLYSTNSGFNWIIRTNGSLSSYYGIFQISVFDAIAVGVNSIFQPLVARTTNNGVNWTYSTFYLNGNEGNLRDICFVSSSLGFAVSNVWNGEGGISLTTNGGVNWTTQLYTRALNTIDFAGTNFGYAAGFMGYILRTTNSGNSWSEQTSGVTATLRSIDAADSLIAYAVGDGGVILKTTNGGITALEPVSNEVPEAFSLSQNYPNPFNPGTNFEFRIAKHGLVNLTIYDILGREIVKLVNEELKPGVYNINWNASGKQSGIYFYRLSQNGFTMTKKMILVK